MRAVDTNVVVRLIVADHPLQTALARTELGNGIFLSHGILMETEWVLRSNYKMRREEVRAALSELIDHSDVFTPEPGAVHWALDRFGSGADLTDMLHIVGAAHLAEFASFETDLARQAGPNSPVRAVALR